MMSNSCYDFNLLQSGSVSERTEAADLIAPQMDSDLMEALSKIQDMDENTSSSTPESVETDGNLTVELVSPDTEADDGNQSSNSSRQILQNSEVNMQSETARVQVLQNSGFEVQSQRAQYQVVTAKSPSRSRRAKVFGLGQHAKARIIELPMSLPSAPPMEYIQLVHSYHQHAEPTIVMPTGPLKEKFIKREKYRKKRRWIIHSFDPWPRITTC